MQRYFADSKITTEYQLTPEIYKHAIKVLRMKVGDIFELVDDVEVVHKMEITKIEDGKAKLDVNIIVEYGSRIPDVAFEIQNRVKKAVENMTGLVVEEVNVHVQGVNTDTAVAGKTETENNEQDDE